MYISFHLCPCFFPEAGQNIHIRQIINSCFAISLRKGESS